MNSIVTETFDLSGRFRPKRARAHKPRTQPRCSQSPSRFGTKSRLEAPLTRGEAAQAARWPGVRMSAHAKRTAGSSGMSAPGTVSKLGSTPVPPIAGMPSPDRTSAALSALAGLDAGNGPETGRGAHRPAFRVPNRTPFCIPAGPSCNGSHPGRDPKNAIGCER